jgi:hypothetical protein
LKYEEVPESPAQQLSEYANRMETSWKISERFHFCQRMRENYKQNILRKW